MVISEQTKIYIKNFGDGNYMWPEALERSVVCLITDAYSHELFKQGREQEYRNYAISELKTSRLKAPDDGTVTLWWNTQAKVDMATREDLFIHDDGRHLYWTQLTDSEPIYETRPDPFPRGREAAEVIITLRPANPWQRLNLKGVPLSLGTLHPHAPNIIRTRMTMAEAGEDNASYIISLIRGETLDKWHFLPSWEETHARSKRSIGRNFDVWETSVVDIIYSAKQASNEGGKEIITKKKEKDLSFSSDEELRIYILELHSIQGGVCALTDLSYTPRIGDTRGNMMMSLDRKDSNLGYVRGNLQLTCWFANRWKGSGDNEEFIDLIDIVKRQSD